MTNTQKFIELAIEGGWKCKAMEDKPFWKLTKTGGSMIVWKEKPLVGNHKSVPKEKQLWPVERVLLNPLAWQAVGKMKGWGMVYRICWNKDMKDCECEADSKTLEEWLAKQLIFVKKLREKSIEEALGELLK